MQHSPTQASGMSRTVAFVSILLVGLVAISLRLYQINSHSFWLDEAYSWTMATKYSFSEILQRTANDFHPPLYFMILKCWIAVFGESEVAQRLLSVTCDMLTLQTLYLLCRDAFAETTGADGKRESRMIGVLAAAMYAVSGIHIQWSVETRMYSMAALLSVASSWLLLRGLASSQRRWWIGYVISALALLYTHNYGVFTVFGQTCFLIGLFARKIVSRCNAPIANQSVTSKVGITLRVMNCDSSAEHRSFPFIPPIAAMIAICVAFLPWLSVLLKQTKQARTDYWIPDMNWWTIPKNWLDLIVHENLRAEQRDSALALSVALICLLVLGCLAWKARSRGAMLVLSMTASPIACSAVISVISLPIITSRHYLTACAFFFCAVAYVIVKVLPKEFLKTVAALLIVNMLYLHFAYRDELQISEDCGMRAAVRHLAKDFQDGDTVVVADQAMLLSTRYYTSRLLRPSDEMHVPLPKLFRSVPLITWLGSALIDDSDRISAAELAERTPTRLWVISDANDSPSGWKELSLRNWKEQSRDSFRGNYYFERDISVWLFLPHVSNSSGKAAETILRAGETRAF